jgi:uncharacterized protein (TIGR02596 family)
MTIFSHRRTKVSGFSLIELLTVMAIFSILTAATLPALRGTLDGYNISGAADLAGAEIALARQTAISRNLPVEVRIYLHDDGTGPAWRGLALVIPKDVTGASADEWVAKGKVLPGNILFDDGGEFSTIVSKASASTTPRKGTEDSTAPGILKNKEYVAFRFQPDGSTNLPSDQAWCVTLRSPRSKPEGGAPAANYISIVLDSLTGRSMTFQPGF